jgi:uncharacterized protein YndB with AHSA1/START domain
MNATQTNDRIETHIDIKAPLARVWRTLTDHEQFGAWFGVKLESPFKSGQPSHGHITIAGFEHVEWNAVVDRIEPETYFSYRWHPYAIDPKIDYSAEPMTLVEFHLSATTDGTRLTVSESGFEAIPAGRRMEAVRMNSQGWSAQMENIVHYVAANR